MKRLDIENRKRNGELWSWAAKWRDPVEGRVDAEGNGLGPQPYRVVLEYLETEFGVTTSASSLRRWLRDGPVEEW